MLRKRIGPKSGYRLRFCVSIDVWDQTPSARDIGVVFGAELSAQQSLFGIHAPDQNRNIECREYETDAGAEDERPAESGDDEAEIARIADRAVNSGRDQTMLRLDGDQAAETIAQHENRPEPHDTSCENEKNAEPAYRLAVDGPDVPSIRIGGHVGAQKRNDRERNKDPAIGTILPLARAQVPFAEQRDDAQENAKDEEHDEGGMGKERLESAPAENGEAELNNEEDGDEGDSRKHRFTAPKCASMHPVDAEIDDVDQRRFPRRRGEEFERIARHRPVMAGALDRVFQRAMFVDRGDRSLEIAFADLAFFQRAAPECALFLRAAAEREDDGQRDLAFAKIIADVLAELGRRATIIERIVDQLKSDAEVEAIAAAGDDLGLRPAGEDGADFCGGTEKRSRLGADHREIIVFAGLGVLRRGKLHDLAFGDDNGGGGENFEALKAADLDHHLEGLAEQIIADEDGCFVPPEHARRELAAAHVAFIDDVVVQQGRRMHEFDGRGELDMPVAAIAAETRRRQSEHRAQPLAAGRDEMIGDFRNHLDVGGGMQQDRLIDPRHVRADKRGERLDLAFAGHVLERYYDAQGPALLPPRAPSGKRRLKHAPEKWEPVSERSCSTNLERDRGSPERHPARAQIKAPTGLLQPAEFARNGLMNDRLSQRRWFCPKIAPRIEARAGL